MAPMSERPRGTISTRSILGVPVVVAEVAECAERVEGSGVGGLELRTARVFLAAALAAAAGAAGASGLPVHEHDARPVHVDHPHRGARTRGDAALAAAAAPLGELEEPGDAEGRLGVGRVLPGGPNKAEHVHPAFDGGPAGLDRRAPLGGDGAGVGVAHALELVEPLADVDVLDATISTTKAAVLMSVRFSIVKD